jgi:hypothetical protein
MKNEIILANIVRLIHMGIIGFVVVCPFLKKRNWMVDVLHVVSVITLLAHWYLDEDTCFLTFLESMLRGIPTNQSFMYSIVSPIYKISDESLKSIVVHATPILGLISVMRIMNNWDVIQRDLKILFKHREAIMSI